MGALSYSAIGNRPQALINLNNKVYQFDEAGALERITTDDSTPNTLSSYEYDSEGRLVRIELPQNDIIIEITYDYEGERIGKRVIKISDGSLQSEARYLGRWVSYHRDGDVASWDRIRQYIFDEKRRLAVLNESGALLSYIHPDQLGSSQLISDTNGLSVCELFYKPYGREVTPNNCPELRHRFNNKETDAETGLVHFGARYYLPDLGRWISADPLLWSEPDKHIKNPQGLNAYAYALNNPATLIDPIGKSPGKYAGEYIDTRRYHIEFEQLENGPVVGVLYRIVEAKPGTWLSKVTYDFGWNAYYSKEQGYGAYNRAIIFPLNNDQLFFDPDKIQPGQLFAVREAPAQKIEMPGATITADLPKYHSSNWEWRFISGGSVTVGGGIDVVTIEMRPAGRPAEAAMFTYTGSALGAGVSSVTVPSDWMQFSTDKVIKIDDFEGQASHIAAGAVYGYEEFTLWNPWTSGKTEDPVTLKSHGFAMPSIGGSHGHLEKRD
jgi:RHS repeat-associated protein